MVAVFAAAASKYRWSAGLRIPLSLEGVLCPRDIAVKCIQREDIVSSRGRGHAASPGVQCPQSRTNAPGPAVRPSCRLLMDGVLYRSYLQSFPANGTSQITSVIAIQRAYGKGDWPLYVSFFAALSRTERNCSHVGTFERDAVPCSEVVGSAPGKNPSRHPGAAPLISTRGPSLRPECAAAACSPSRSTAP
jgi:hypothetical protein